MSAYAGVIDSAHTHLQSLHDRRTKRKRRLNDVNTDVTTTPLARCPPCPHTGDAAPPHTVATPASGSMAGPADESGSMRDPSELSAEAQSAAVPEARQPEETALSAADADAGLKKRRHLDREHQPTTASIAMSETDVGAGARGARSVRSRKDTRRSERGSANAPDEPAVKGDETPRLTVEELLSAESYTEREQRVFTTRVLDLIESPSVIEQSISAKFHADESGTAKFHE
jgi:hypothetical protein